MAIVELAEQGSLSEQDVIEFCARSMANFRVPRYVHFVTEWPLTGSGKIKKDELRKAFVEPMVKEEA
jgi:acyl-CoA synthetase (AMP-forming)/AMP-acid ligase II